MHLSRLEMILFFLISLAFGNDGDVKQKNRKIRHLRVITGEFPPTIRFIRDSNGLVTGFSGPVYKEFEWLSERLQFTYNITFPPENTSGVKINGTWIGLIGELVKGKADLALGPFALSLQRYEAIDFVGFIGGDYTSLLVKYPKDVTINPWSSLKPFTYQTWMGLLVSMVAVLCAFAILVFIRAKMGQKPSKILTVGDLTMYVLATITAQGESYRSGHRSFGIIAAFWCFLSFVMVNSYNTTLVSYLSLYYKAPEINSMSQLAASDTYKMLTLRGSYMETDVLNSVTGTFKILGDKLRKCDKCRLDSLPDIGQKVLDEDSTALLPVALATGLMYRNNRPKGNCRITLANVKYNYKHMFFGAAKSRFFYEDVTREMLRVHEYGFMTLWIKADPEYNLQSCLLNYGKDGYETIGSSSRLKLKHLAAPFYILIVGYFVCLFAFICEKIGFIRLKLIKGRN